MNAPEAARAPRIPNILSIAGSDPSGGAGIQADLKSIAACGGYGMAAITALTAQNTRGVASVHIPPAGFLAEQLGAVASDVRIDAIKIGMLGNTDVIRAVTAWLAGFDRHARPAVVLDPVLIATSGASLLEHDAEAALRALLPLADVLTPNIPELAVLAGEPAAAGWDQVLGQARRVAARYSVLVLAKGGHLAGERCPDALVGADGVLLEIPGERVPTANSHGTGCSLSSALATLYARTGSWMTALELAKAWLAGALRASDELDVGGGNIGGGDIGGHEHGVPGVPEACVPGVSVEPGASSGAGGEHHGPVNHFASLWSGAAVPNVAALASTWWEDIAGLLAGIDRLSFIRRLTDGSLERRDFTHYLAQDALYLRGYARVLARASELAPNAAAQRFWAASASHCLDEELQLHHGRLEFSAGGKFAHEPDPTPITTAYLNHLTASGHRYEELVAAILPCFWIYQDTGSRLAEASHPAHPYADWLAMYSSPAFDAATAEAIDVVQGVAMRSAPAVVAAMRRAFHESSRHELLFFAQTAADGYGERVGVVPDGVRDDALEVGT